MSQRLPSVRPRKVIRALEKAGWRHVRTKGSHRHFGHPDHPHVISVPMHSRDVKRGTLDGIMKDAGIDREQFIRLLR